MKYFQKLSQTEKEKMEWKYRNSVIFGATVVVSIETSHSALRMNSLCYPVKKEESKTLKVINQTDAYFKQVAVEVY